MFVVKYVQGKLVAKSVCLVSGLVYSLHVLVVRFVKCMGWLLV